MFWWWRRCVCVCVGGGCLRVAGAQICPFEVVFVGCGNALPCSPCSMEAAQRRLQERYDAELLATGGVPTGDVYHGTRFTPEEIRKEMRRGCVADMQAKVKYVGDPVY
jgi:hypothetical protein